MNSQQILEAIQLLAECDHFDNSRRAAGTLPADFRMVDLQRAADGCTQILHALDIHRRTAA